MFACFLSVTRAAYSTNRHFPLFTRPDRHSVEMGLSVFADPS